MKYLILLLLFVFIACDDKKEVKPTSSNVNDTVVEVSKNTSEISSNQDLIKIVDYKGLTPLLAKRNDTTYVVNFWATWCAPCIKEFPVLDDTYELLKKDYVFIMVSDESIDKIKKFAANKPYQFVFAKTNNLMTKGITYVPQTFVLDKNGKTIKHHPTIFEGSASSISNTIQNWIKN